MPTSVTDDDFRYTGTTPNASGASLDVLYLTRNISITHTPTPEKAYKSTLLWFPETTDFSSDFSLEASTPQLKPCYRKNSFRRFNCSSLDIDDSLFDVQIDISKKILSTPDPVVSRSALRRFGAISLKSQERSNAIDNDLEYHNGFSVSDGESVIECRDTEVQFALENSNVSDITDETYQKVASYVSTIKPDYDQSSILDSEFEQTPKMTSYLKKHEFNSILNARTPHPKRTMKRRMVTKSVPSYSNMTELSTNSPRNFPGMSSDSRDINYSDGNSSKGSSRLHSSKNFRNRALSDRDLSHRGSEVISDYYASYLDYADSWKADLRSPVNDCVFESSNGDHDEGSLQLQTIPELETDELICDSPMEISNVPKESSPELKCETVHPAVPSEGKFSKSIAGKCLTSRKFLSTLMFSEIERMKQITIKEGLVPLLAGIQFIPRPMSFRVESPSEEEKLSLAKLTSTVGCKVLHKLLIPATLQAILKNDIFQAMGNGNSRVLTSNKFLPTVVKKQTPSHGLQRRRYGPREVHRNIWRLEKKSVVKPGKSIKDTETVVHNERPEVPKRSTYRKRNAVSKEKEIEITVKELADVKVQCAAPNVYSLPSRSEVLPPDGDSLRSDAEKKHQSSETHSRCPSCTSSQLKLSKAYAQKGAVAVTLEKVQRDFSVSQTKIKDLECELDEYKKIAHELSTNIKDLESEMCQLQKDKALLQQELTVTRKQLTRILEQSDASDSSHVSSVFVSGSQNLTDDGLGDEALPDEDVDESQEEDDSVSKSEFSITNTHQTRLDITDAELSILKEAQTRGVELESIIRHCEERIIELEELLKQATARNEDIKDVATQTLTRDGTFTRTEKTKIPKRMLGHHSSLPVISDPNNLVRCKTPTGSLTRLENLQRSLRIKEREITTLRKEMTEVGKELEKHKEREVMQQSTRIGELTTENRRLKQEIEVLKENYQRETVLRKKYFNIAEDLKGKIRVFCRVKPFDGTHRNAPVLEIPDEYTLLLRTHRAQYEFTFDGVFDSDRSQEEVFRDVENLVQSAVDGYNVCIFAYGQTGSGKTYTLVGNESHPGIGPRAFQKIFDLVRENQCELDFRITVCVYELYNERLIDLLKDSTEDNLKIRRDHYGLVYVQGSESREVKNERQLSEIFEEACRNRHVGATRMNTESSRSHLVITIRVESTNKITGTVSRGKLSIVDLAGSERVGKTAAVAQQLKEANSINKSLSALGDVIAALSSEQQHVPYRNNKLTLLMQDSLGSNAKTLMFVNISSSELNVEESLNSLTYASRVKQITNSASRMSESKEVSRLRSIIMKLSKESKTSMNN